MAVVPAITSTGESSSHQTHCWRETDSNSRLPREEKPARRDGFVLIFSTAPLPRGTEGSDRSPLARSHCLSSELRSSSLTQRRSRPFPSSFCDRPAIFFIPASRPRRLAPSSSTACRRASRRALRCGHPACAGKWRRRHGSGERLCMQR